MTETIASQIAHWLTLGMVATILGFTLKQHKVWVRLKDRVNTLWSDRCTQTGDRYFPLEDGK